MALFKLQLILLLLIAIFVSSYSLSSAFSRYSGRLVSFCKNNECNQELTQFVNETTQIFSKAEGLLNRISKYDQPKEVVFSELTYKPVGPYSQGIKKNDVLYTSGCIGIDPATGKLISDDLKEQVIQALKNLEYILFAAKSNWNKVYKVTIYTTDLKSFGAINEIYSNLLKANQITQFPARTTIEAAALPLGAKFEIDAIAGYDE
jgi:2-iminobutanoate/2-iminopropanoate deaminase